MSRFGPGSALISHLLWQCLAHTPVLVHYFLKNKHGVTAPDSSAAGKPLKGGGSGSQLVASSSELPVTPGPLLVEESSLATLPGANQRKPDAVNVELVETKTSGKGDAVDSGNGEHHGVLAREFSRC